MSAVAFAKTMPLEIRMEAAWRSIAAGADPYDMLAAALWPEEASGVFEDEPTLVDGTCSRGHPWTEENTRNKADGHRRCRVCERETNAARKRDWSRRNRKVPCGYCGAPATRPTDQSRTRHAVPRCRACWLQQRRAA